VQGDVDGRIIRIAVHRIRADFSARRGKADVVHLQRDDPRHPAGPARRSGVARVHHRHDAAVTRWRCAPRPAMPSSITSPGLRYTGGFWPRPTPGGVPVEITSPASSVMWRLVWLTSVATSKIMVRV